MCSTLWIDEVKLVYNTTSSGTKDEYRGEFVAKPHISDSYYMESKHRDNKAEVFDMKGRLLFSSIMGTNQLDVSVLPPGRYVINLIDTVQQQKRGEFMVVK